jgi:undecaprenyl-diphosphatase
MENEAVRLMGLIGIGSIPTAILGLLLHRAADRLFGAVWIVGVMLLVTGTVLWVTRRLPAGGRPLQRMQARDALAIGLIQGIAIIPGISRSGSTISGALLLGVDRKTAGRYSFLLSIPAILGALAVSLDPRAMQASVPAGVTLLGTLTAGIVGFLALRALLRVVDRGRLHLFAPYCWLLGLTALLGGVS